ncbi:MAG: hypothetical protein ACKVQQ_16105 [Burkholderiales bacterium]
MRGAVVVAGSHGGRIACYLGAAAGAHALILNDAGVGLDRAGIAGLAWLDVTGMAVATVSHGSAVLGNGEDTLANGVISHANGAAAVAGVIAGMPAAEAAALLAHAPAAHSPPPDYAEGRAQVATSHGVDVWVLDSVGKLLAEDEGRALIIGSHGALHGGRADSALNIAGRPLAARLAVFSDAGGRATSRLPELSYRGVPAATVSASSARIGDGHSLWESGCVSNQNAVARSCGGTPGVQVAAWVETILSRVQAGSDR